MSLIDDALKAAQREKSRRDSQSVRPFAPVLVKLRAKPRGESNRTHIMVAAAGLLVVATTAFMWMRIDKAAQLPAVPPVTSAILTEALSDPSTANSSAVADRRPASASDASATRPAGRNVVTPRLEPRTIAQRAAGSTRAPDRGAVLQGVPQNAPAQADVASVQSRSAGALRIAVEQPPDATLLFNQAIAAHRAGNFATARSLYERVLALNPNDADALNNLGVLLSAQRQFDRALDLLRRGASIAPRNAGTWNNIGTVLREQGKSGDAIAAFRHALTIDPRHQGARVGLAQQYLAINSLLQAREVLGEVLLENPSLAEAHYTLGQVLERQGDRLGAIASYTSFIRVAPPTLSGHVELVRRRIDLLSARE